MTHAHSSRHLTTRDPLELSDEVRTLIFTDDIHLFMQAGGCLEIREKATDRPDDDLVHICGDDVSRFLTCIGEIIQRCPPRF